MACGQKVIKPCANPICAYRILHMYPVRLFMERAYFSMAENRNATADQFPTQGQTFDHFLTFVSSGEWRQELHSWKCEGKQRDIIIMHHLLTPDSFKRKENRPQCKHKTWIWHGPWPMFRYLFKSLLAAMTAGAKRFPACPCFYTLSKTNEVFADGQIKIDILHK